MADRQERDDAHSIAKLRQPGKPAINAARHAPTQRSRVAGDEEDIESARDGELLAGKRSEGRHFLLYFETPAGAGRRLFPVACGNVTPIASPSVTARS